MALFVNSPRVQIGKRMKAIKVDESIRRIKFIQSDTAIPDSLQ
jgi:hypothetical protein